MSTELAKRSYVSALYNPHWQKRFRLHTHSSCRGLNGSQLVTPVVTGITTESASPKTHIRNLKRSCRNKIRQWLEDALFRMVPDSKILPKTVIFPWGYPAGSSLGRWCWSPGPPACSALSGTAAPRMLCFTSKCRWLGAQPKQGIIFFFVYRGNCLVSFVRTCV